MKNQKSPVVARPVHLTPPSENDLQTLARLLHNHAPYDSVFDLPIPDVQVIRASRTHGELFHVVYRPSVCIVAQGSKTVFLGTEKYTYDANHMLVCSVELPLASQVTEVSPQKPYLCLRVFFDPERIARLTLKVFLTVFLPCLRSGGSTWQSHPGNWWGRGSGCWNSCRNPLRRPFTRT